MENKNDKKIFELKEKLEKRKELLGEKPSNNFITNCMFTMFGITYNFHAMNYFELSMISSLLKGLNNPDLSIGNYKVKEYLTDALNKMIILDYNVNLAEIKELEVKLDSLISSETKTSMEIDKIAKLIG
jgi:hypothetical protein